MDELKKYLQQNLDRLDIDTPGDEVWQRVEKELMPAKIIYMPLLVKRLVAACIIVLAGVGVYFLTTAGFDGQVVPDQLAEENVVKSIDSSVKPFGSARPLPKMTTGLSEPHNNRLSALVKPAKKRQVLPHIKRATDPALQVFNQMKGSYAAMVNIQLHRVASTPIYVEDAGYFSLFKKQFRDLDADEKQVKEDILKTGVTDDLIQRMINVYQEKLSLLKQLQSEINKMNNRAKKADNGAEISTPSFITL